MNKDIKILRIPNPSAITSDITVLIKYVKEKIWVADSFNTTHLSP